MGRPKRDGRGCASHSGKHPYPTGAAARSEVDRIRRHGKRRESGKKPIRPYVCTSCGSWFLTSDPM